MTRNDDCRPTHQISRLLNNSNIGHGKGVQDIPRSLKSHPNLVGGPPASSVGMVDLPDDPGFLRQLLGLSANR